jgi:hypothetical protein
VRCGVWGVVLIPSSGAVVWVIPYEPLKIKQQQLHLQQQQQQQIVVQQHTIDGCLKRLVTALSRADSLKHFEIAAAVSQAEVCRLQQEILELQQENLELQRQQSMRTTRSCGVQACAGRAVSAADAAAAAAADAAAAAAADAFKHTTALIGDDVISALSAAAAAIRSLQRERDDALVRASLLQRRCSELEQAVDGLQQQQHVQQQQQALAHSAVVASLTDRLAAAALPSEEAARDDAGCGLQLVSSQSILAEEAGVELL